jgi:outer membrane lipoprotein-sorting protein
MTSNDTLSSPSPSSPPASSMSRSRRLMWAVPVAGVVAVAAAVTVPMVASADPSLPSRSAAQLLVDVSTAKATPLSGTVVETARLGLPALPEARGSAISPTALLAGSHTARIWLDGPDKARVALVGSLAETDLIRNGRDVWLWTSGKNTAQHGRLPAGHERAPATSTPESVTPQEAARRALAAIDPSTRVRVDGTASVAGRSAYELVLAPRDPRSLVGDVRIAVDSTTFVPLRVQVHARGATGKPAFETTFTSVTFARPSASVFRFSPPPGAKVSELGSPSAAGHPTQPPTAAAPARGSEPRVIGKGWTAVLEVPGAIKAPTGAKGEPGGSSELLGTFQRAMTPVAGGRALQTALVSVLVTDDGRLLVGAVPKSVLVRAAGS